MQSKNTEIQDQVKLYHGVSDGAAETSNTRRSSATRGNDPNIFQGQGIGLTELYVYLCLTEFIMSIKTLK